MIKEFKVLKYLLLNNFQQKTLDFTNNLLIEKEGYGYDCQYFPELMKSGEDNLKNLEKVKNYFVLRSEYNTISDIDKKLFKIIDSDLKDYFNDKIE